GARAERHPGPQGRDRRSRVEDEAAPRGAPARRGISFGGDRVRYRPPPGYPFDYVALGRESSLGHLRPPAGVETPATGLPPLRPPAQGARRPGHGDRVDLEGHDDRPAGAQGRRRRRGRLRGVVAMSRIGKKPVPIPTGVNVTLKDATVAVKGPKGELKRP